MRRINIFLLTTIVSLIALLVVVLLGFYVVSTHSQTPYNWGNYWGEMMGGGMMGGAGPPTQAQNASVGPYIIVAVIALAAIAVVGIGGLVYFYVHPQGGNQPVAAPAFNQPVPSISNPLGSEVSNGTAQEVSPYESVLKTLNSDERKVIEILTAHGGKYLQKYIRSESGLSRLQTHRIVTRLAERGIVTLEKTGNTNTVLVADWLKVVA